MYDITACVTGADPGFLKKGGGGSILGYRQKKGGPGEPGSNFMPNVKKPTTWAKGGGSRGSGPGSGHVS